MPIDLLSGDENQSTLFGFARDEALRQGLNPDLVQSVMQAESKGKATAISPAGARGPMQLMPGTASDMNVDINDPQDNIRGGVKYLRQQLDRFNGNVPLAVAAYNAGPGNVSNGRIPQNGETPQYVDRVMTGFATNTARSDDRSGPRDLLSGMQQDAQPGQRTQGRDVLPGTASSFEIAANQPATLQVGPWDTRIHIPSSVDAALSSAGGTTVAALDGIKSLVGLGDTPEERATNKEAMAALDKTHPVASFAGKAAADMGMMYAGGKTLSGAGQILRTLKAAPNLAQALETAGTSVSAPTTFKPAIGGGALYGAVTDPENRLASAAAGGIGGGVGMGVGKAIGGAMGRMTNPVPIGRMTQGELETLGKAKALGLPLNVAQETGNKALKWVDSALDNLPSTSAMQATQKGAQREAWQKAVLGAVGENQATQATPAVLGSTYARLGDQFQALSAKNDVDLGGAFFNAIQAIDSSTTPFSQGINGVVNRALDLAAKGKISGKEYQLVRSSLSKASRGAGVNNPELGHALRSLRNALDDAAEASMSAEDKAAWQLVRSQYKSLKTIEKAADPATGNISPLKLYSELGRANPQGMRYGMGDQTLPNLAKVGKQYIAEALPDSGTAQRSWYMNMLQNPTTSIGAVTGGLLTGGAPGAVVGMAAGAGTPLAAQRLIWSGSNYLRNGLLSQGALGKVQSIPALLGYYAGVPSGLLSVP